MTSALFQLSSNGGTSYLTAGTAMADANALAYVSSGSYSIKARLDSTAGVDTVQWTITSADDLHIASLPAVTSNADKTCTFSVPKTGGAWLLQCKVNGGQSQGRTDPALTRAMAIKVLNSVDNQEVAVGESTEAGPYGWTQAFNELSRGAGGGGGGGGGNVPIRQVFWDEGNVSPADPVYATFATAFTAATALLTDANGPVEIVVLEDNNPPEFPSGTYDCQNRIEIVGWTGRRDYRVTVALLAGFKLRNPRALRHLEINHTLSAAWLDTSAATNLNLTLDNTTILDDGSSGADACTLAASTPSNRLILVGGSTYTGSTNAFTTLSSGKILSVYVKDGSINGETVHGSAGSLSILVGGSGSYETQASFSGTTTIDNDVVTALGLTTTAVGVNNQRIHSVADPTSAQDAATWAFTLQQGCDLIYDQGGTAGPRTFTTLAAAVTAAASIPGKVRIGIKSTSGTPTTTGVTYALDRRIELVGLQATGNYGRVTLTMVASAVFQNPCAFRNLEIEHDLASSWIVASSGNLVFDFDNVSLIDNGASADICTLNASSNNFIRFLNGSTIANAGGGYLGTISGGKVIYLTLEDTSAFGDDTITGTVSNLIVTQSGSATFGAQTAFSGNTFVTHMGVASLAQANADVSVNDNKITNVSAPTASADAVNKRYIEGATTWSIAGSGTKSFGASAAVNYGYVELTGLLTGDVTIDTDGAEKVVTFYRNTTGHYTVKLGTNTDGVYIAPGQVRRTNACFGRFRSEGGRVMEFETSLDLSSGYSVGTYDVTMLKIPAAFDVDRVEVRCTTSVSGGTITVAAGVSGSYDQLITATAISTAGDVVGLDTTHAGSDFSGKLAAHYSSAQTVRVRVVVSGGTLSAGALRVFLVGRCVEG